MRILPYSGEHLVETAMPNLTTFAQRGRPTIRNSPCNMKATGCQHCDSGKCVPYQLIAGVDTRNHPVMRRVRIVAGSAAPGQPAAPSSPPAAASVHYTGPATAFPEPDAGMHRTEEDVTAFMNHLKIKQLPPSPK